MRNLGAVATGLVLGVLLVMAPGEAWAALSRLHTQGTQWVDAAGKPVVLRGCNLGNWLLQEMWMHNMKLEGIPDQYTLEQVLARRFGEERKDALLEVYRGSYITGWRDFRVIKSFGMNVVRVPIWYTLIEDEAHPYHIRPKAWEHLDRALRWAEVAGLYVILDLHGAAGGQSDEHHTGREGQNRLWIDAEYQRRTVWLWKQIAARYRDRNVVAGYDLLNEPWGGPREQVRSLLLECYRAIRAVDPDHIIVFAGFPDGFEFLGKPAEQGLTNVAVDMHFYPGVFGGNPSPATHEAWLKELPGWQKRQQAVGLPILVGEMNVVMKRAGGARMMRREFDAYEKLGWATTMWSYKVFTAEGGTAGGSWGMVTNRPGAGAPLVKVDTWNWAGRSGRFADASVEARPRFVAPSGGPVKAYLVVKAGSNEKLDVVLDEMGLTDEATGKPVPVNGSFGKSEGWRPWRQRGEIAADYDYRDAPPGGKGPALRLTGAGSVNGGVYAPVTLQGGHRYALRGVFEDRGSKDGWVEVYLRSDKPVEGADYVAGPAPGAQIDINTSSYAAIAAYFQSLSTAPYVVYEDLRRALSAR